jgi:electron transport complex protein RnfG
MTDAPHPIPPGPGTTSFAMIGTLGLVATLCGILVVAAHQGTLEAVTANKRIALERAVFKVVPGSTRLEEFLATPDGIVTAGGSPAEDALRFYVTYDAGGDLKGVVAEAGAMGYADVVRVLYAYDPGRQVINGFGVVAQRETPGIGDKIIADKAFLRNFEALDARLAADGKVLANPIRTVKHGGKANPWEIDAISGATVTSKAVGKGIHDSAQRLLPRLRAHRGALRNTNGKR